MALITKRASVRKSAFALPGFRIHAAWPLRRPLRPGSARPVSGSEAFPHGDPVCVFGLLVIGGVVGVCLSDRAVAYGCRWVSAEEP